MTAQPVIVYGSGGFAREVAWLAEECGHPVVCFIDDDDSRTGRRVNDIPVMSCPDGARQFPGALVALGIGAPGGREAAIQKATAHGLEAISLVHPRVEKSRRVTFGKGVVVCAGNILTTNIAVGDYAQINLDCTIGHDAVLEEYATLAPGVHVSGYVTIGRGAYIGTGAVIINGTAERQIVIGQKATVGAGACVTQSVDAGVTVVGVPAKPMVRR